MNRPQSHQLTAGGRPACGGPADRDGMLGQHFVNVEYEAWVKGQ
jgi:hypothetical protein